ncbi:MAG: hypothetical protein EXR62_11965 [Chloroflexi bacterium]|nr:hypothetical protein [Chloroflexota bacterium]
MPINKKQAGVQPAGPRQSGFDRHFWRLKQSRVVPVISDEAMGDLVLGGYRGLVEGYADHEDDGKPYRYPLPDKDNLPRVSRFFKVREGLTAGALKSEYLNYVKNHLYSLAQAEGADGELLAQAEAQVDALTVSEFAELLGYPNLKRDAEHPLLTLANLPARTFLTTSPYTFMEAALQVAGKKPRTELCRWRKELDSIDSAIDAGYKPSTTEPLVYHLHGLDKYDNSLVLTEDDHLEFLVNICQGQGNDAADRIPALVRKALVDDLVLLGFSLSKVTFRALYAGLIRTGERQEERGVCCLQLVPDEEEKRDLQDYLEREAKFDVFWGDVRQYTQQLGEMLKAESRGGTEP